MGMKTRGLYPSCSEGTVMSKSTRNFVIFMRNCESLPSRNGFQILQLFSSAFPSHLIQLMCFNLAWLFQGVRRAWGGSRIALSYKLLPEDITDVKENATFLGKIESSHLSNNGTFSWEKLALCVIRIYNRKKYTLKVLKDETKTLIDKHFAEELFHNQYLRWLVNSQDIW